MQQPSSPASMAPGRHQRRLRNYLIDRHFQLKYSGYLMGIAVLLSLCLGTILWRTSQAVLAQSHKAVQQGEQVVTRGKEVLSESRKVSAVVQMNIVRDPVYSQSPALLEAFKSDSEKQDLRLADQQKALEQQALALKQQAADLHDRQTGMFFTLCGALTLLVVLVGLAGIVVTHRVAGPIYKMKRQIREVGKGRLEIPSKLRRGDELVDFFEAFETMVLSLRRRQETEIAELEKALSGLEGRVSPSDIEPLRKLREDMKRVLEITPSMNPGAPQVPSST